MAKNKIFFSEEMKRWYSSDLKTILSELKDGKKVYTHHFEYTLSNGKRHYNFVGKSQRPHLLKCLRTLETDGLINKISLESKINQWEITDKGKYFLKIHQTY